MSLEVDLHRLEKSPEEFPQLLRVYQRLGISDWLGRYLSLGRRPLWSAVKDCDPAEVKVPFDICLDPMDPVSMIPYSYLGFSEDPPVRCHPLEVVKKLREFLSIHSLDRRSISGVQTRYWWTRFLVDDYSGATITFRSEFVLSSLRGDPHGFSIERPLGSPLTRSSVHFGVRVLQEDSANPPGIALGCFHTWDPYAAGLTWSSIVEWMHLYRSWVGDS